jgi:hypothetical protein
MEAVGNGRWLQRGVAPRKLQLDQHLTIRADLPGCVRLLEVRASDDEWAVEVDGAERAVLLDAHLVRLRETIKSEIVLLDVNLCEEISFERFVLHLIDLALEY